ncbi:helix-turn-helix domain-containing protein [Ruminococcus sp.]|uniref:helix-turn-helix domain-containing protein n=1 Tax=Ruminococcus sp. TaxID=41978 RepID=UPI003A8E4288
MNNIKILRQERGWTQAELGQRLKVKDSAISKYENGSLQLSGDLLVQLADIFGVSTDYILGRTKYRTYEGTSFEVPKIIDLLSRGDMEMISNWAELSPENQARIADYAKILQKAEAADKNKK